MGDILKESAGTVGLTQQTLSSAQICGGSFPPSRDRPIQSPFQTQKASQAASGSEAHEPN